MALFLSPGTMCVTELTEADSKATAGVLTLAAVRRPTETLPD